jgi:hypothetical protein
MTFVGKLLVIFQVVLSLFFMAFAITVFNVQTDWKKNAQSAKSQVQVAANETKDLQAAYDKFKTDQNAMVLELTDRAEKAEAKNKALTGDLALTKSDLNAALTERDNQTTQARVSSEEADSRRAEALEQAKQNKKLYAQNIKLGTKLTQEESKVFNLTIAKQVMQAKHNNLLEKLATINEIALARKYDINIANYKAETAPAPELDGLIIDTVNNKRGIVDLVEITLGSNDGIAKGHVLSVYREKNAKYKGAIRIISVEPNKAVGSVIPQMKTGIIERGDNVTTKL